MRNQTLPGFLMALACACGGGDSHSLDGTWGAADSDGCKTALLIEGDSYERIYACVLTNETIGYESYRGTFTERDGTLNVSITHSSCPDAEPHEEQMGYEFVGKRLRVRTDSGLQLFERIDGPTARSGTAVFGCYDGDSFSQNPVRAL